MITRTKRNRNSVPVTNNRNILDWFVNKHQLNCFKEKRKSLMSDLRSELFDTFGKQDVTITGEFRNKLWTLKFNDLTFNVYSASGKGTSIEVCDLSYEQVRNGEKEKEIIQFLIELDDILQKK